MRYTWGSILTYHIVYINVFPKSYPPTLYSACLCLQTLPNAFVSPVDQSQLDLYTLTNQIKSLNKDLIYKISIRYLF